jgi:hypothetical protein
LIREPQPLLDESGCLTERGVAALRAAPPGQGPPELAAHVVACRRCQRRLLEQDRPRATGRKPRRRPPSLLRLTLIALLGLLLALGAIALLRLR